jgi:hypothetical protein
MESTKLEDVAKNYILEMVYSNAPSSETPKTSQDKYEVLESILYEKEGGTAKYRAGYEKTFGKKGLKGKAAEAAGKLKEKAAEGASKISSASGKKKAAMGAGALAAGTGAWYLYRKLRKRGVEKKKAAAAAAEAAKKKAQKTGASKDKETAQKWAQRARS